MKLGHNFQEASPPLFMNPASQPASERPPFVDLETAARMAGVTRRTVQNKLASREIPPKAVKMNGRQKLVAVKALEAAFGPLGEPAREGEAEGDVHGTLHGSFHEGQAEVIELRARVAAKDEIIAGLQGTLDHERRDREHERENWRKTLERTQATLLATQDTPTARALAGASAEREAIEVTPEPGPPAAPVMETATGTGRRKARPARKSKPRRWWRVFGG